VTTVNGGLDKISKALGAFTIGAAGTATASSATSLTTSGLTASALVGQIIVAQPSSGNMVFGVCTANTTTVITVDQWYTAAGATGGSTPSSTSNWIAVCGNAPAQFMGLSSSNTAPAATDTTLGSEITTGGGGLVRAAATYAHTTGATTYTLTKTFTANGSDTLPVTVYKIGIFDAATNAAGGTMLFETSLNASATLSASGDQLTVTDTVTV
jgi:hypothetical protein